MSKFGVQPLTCFHFLPDCTTPSRVATNLYGCPLASPNPAESGLFIGGGHKSLPFFLFFGDAARQAFPGTKCGWARTFLPWWSLQMPRRRKTKRKIRGCSLL